MIEFPSKPSFSAHFTAPWTLLIGATSILSPTPAMPLVDVRVYPFSFSKEPDITSNIYDTPYITLIHTGTKRELRGVFRLVRQIKSPQVGPAKKLRKRWCKGDTEMTWNNSRQHGTREPNPKGSDTFCLTGGRSSPQTNTLGCPA